MFHGRVLIYVTNMNMSSSSARPLTVILNTNHTKRFALILQPSDVNGAKDSILRESRNKFRIKALSVIYLRGGTLLDDVTGLAESDSMVWVGKGELYNGPPANPSRSNNPAEVRIIAEKSFIDDHAIKQLEMIAGFPGVRLAVGMPDLHPGNRFPIGCAIASGRVGTFGAPHSKSFISLSESTDGVYPALIGSDIGCGIALYHLSPHSRSLPTSKKVAAMLTGLDEPWAAGSVTDWLARYGIVHSSAYDQSLGTVGAGNHFAEICTVERIVDEAAADSLGVTSDGVYLLGFFVDPLVFALERILIFTLVHSGSRGLGGSILSTHTTEESNPYLPPDSPLLHPYLAEHDHAVKWAIANRDLLAHRIKQCLFSPSETTDTPSVDLGKILDVTHNSVTKHTLKLAGEIRDVWIHRKGAAPADQGIAPCPGSRGDFSWLLQPVGDGEYNGTFRLLHKPCPPHAVSYFWFFCV